MLCQESDLHDNSMKRFTVDAREILLVRYANKYYALDDRCTHRGGPLSEGSLEHVAVTCPWHFGQFDLRTGQVKSPPPVDPIKTYPVIIEDGQVKIALP
jgi:nitrite reductase/ring-hydroxylating ferredoxin subunit